MLTMPVVTPSPPVRSSPGPADHAPAASTPPFSQTLKATTSRREPRPDSAIDAPKHARPLREPRTSADAAVDTGDPQATDARPDENDSIAEQAGDPQHSDRDPEPEARDRQSRLDPSSNEIDEPDQTADAEPNQPVVEVDENVATPEAVILPDAQGAIADPEVAPPPATSQAGEPAADRGATPTVPQGAAATREGDPVQGGVSQSQTTERPPEGRVAAVTSSAAEPDAAADAPASQVVKLNPEAVDRRSPANAAGSERSDSAGSGPRTAEAATRGSAAANTDATADDRPGGFGDSGDSGDSGGEGDAAEGDGGAWARRAAAASSSQPRGEGVDGVLADTEASAARVEEPRPVTAGRAEARPAEPVSPASTEGSPDAGVFKLVAQPVVARVGGEPFGLIENGPQALTPGRSAGSAQSGATSSGSGAPDADGPATAATVRGLAAALMQKGGSVTIRLMPEQLGELKIQMTIDRGNVSVDLTARSGEAHDLLSRSMGTLRSALEARGLGVERMSVHLSTQGPTHSGQPSGEQAPARDEQRTGGQHDAGGGASRGRDDGRGTSEDRSGGAGTEGDQDDSVGRAARGADARGFATRLRLSLDAVA